MTTRSRTLLLPLLTLVAFGSGCRDTPTGPDPDPTPTFSFSYSSDRSGSYQTQGDVSLDAARRPEYGSWTAALVDAESDVGIVAARARTAPRADVFILALHKVTAPGTYPLDGGCVDATPSACALGYLGFDYDWNDGDHRLEAEYFITSGTVTVTAIDGDRIRGTFQGSGPKLSSGSQPTISITNGAFDVPIVRNTVPLRNQQPAEVLKRLQRSDPR